MVRKCCFALELVEVLPYLLIVEMSSFLGRVWEQEVLIHVKQSQFLEHALQLLADFCSGDQYIPTLESNIPLSLLERRTELEVRNEKLCDVRVIPSCMKYDFIPSNSSIITSIADIVHNVSTFDDCPVQEWNDRGLFRLLYRCASLPATTGSNVKRVSLCAAACRALVSATTHKCVRKSLAVHNDCLHGLLYTLNPLREDEMFGDYINCRAEGLLLLASLMSEQPVRNFVWTELRKESSVGFFPMLLQALKGNSYELQEAAIYCLTQMAVSLAPKIDGRKSEEQEFITYFDNLLINSQSFSEAGRVGMGDYGNKGDCQPDYVVEELCRVLIEIFRKLWDDKKYNSGQDERWIRVCRCISSLLVVSERGRLYGMHRQLPRLLLSALQNIRDQLSVHAKPVEHIRNANHHPTLRTLYWILTLMDSSMINCSRAKELLCEDNVAISLNKLWPWCMMTEQLRYTIVHLLLTLSNDCSKACSSMSMCVGGRTLVGELCTLVSRECAVLSRPRSDTLLVLSLNTLRHCLHHQHCRNIILKSDVLSCVSKLCVRVSAGAGGAWMSAAIACVAAWESAARHADGASALLQLRPNLTRLTTTLREPLMAAYAHAAHYHSLTYLQSADLLEMLSGTLLTGTTVEIISAARAVWAIAANHHKAKLLLRRSGLTSAVQSALQRLQRAKDDPTSQRALELLTYTNNVLQAS